MTLTRCSLNCIDDSTRFHDIKRLRSKYPFAEFGISYSARAGDAGTGCYASFDYIERAAREFSGSDTLALHLCYREATENFLNGTGPVAELAKHFKRVQINFSHENKYRDYDLGLIRAVFTRHPATTIITTHNPDNADLWEKLRGFSNHEVLFDASSGRGIVGEYPDPIPGIACGYAGGLSPENLPERLPLIHAASLRQPDPGKRILWTDLESRLRAGRRDFPLDRAEQTLTVMKEYLLKSIGAWPGFLPGAIPLP